MASLGALLLAGCNLGDGDDEPSGEAGSEQDKPGGSGTYYVDPNQGGRAARLRIEEVTWGRLVDVYALEPGTSQPEATPRFQDFVIDETVVTNSVDYVLETNPATQRTRLIVQREKDDTNSAQTFNDLLLAASTNLPTIEAKNDDGSSVGPFSQVPRNSTVVIRFNDLLEDDQDAVDDLMSNVKVLTSYPPSVPYEARVVFDPNHGDVAGGEFHTTRVLVDMTISELEAEDLGSLVSPNLLGLPESQEISGDPNVSVRIPTELDFAIGQFTLLTNLRGQPVDANGGPTSGNTTADVVRAFRSGNSTDPNNGFLFDQTRPQVVGGFRITVDSASADPSGEAGYDFLLDLTYTTVCQSAPAEGDLLEIGNGRFLEVTADAGAPVGGSVSDVQARVLTDDPVASPGALLGGGVRRTPYDPFDMTIDPSCWLSFLPVVSDYPPTDVVPGAQVIVRFSEPMDPDTISPYGTFQVFRDGGAANPAVDTVAGTIVPADDLRTFSFVPALPYAHSGDGRIYDVEMLGGLSGIKDLAGNTLLAAIDPVEFSIDPAADQGEAAAVTLRFNALDEYQEGAASGFNDFRGTVFPDFSRGVVRPRPVSRASYTVDPANMNTIPSGFVPVATPLPPVVSPLNPLGSKLQTVWRYMDFGWLLSDETKIDLDVEGLNWTPNTGNLVADVFERFEIRLSHSEKLPDLSFMVGMMGAPDTLRFPDSGLYDSPRMFEENILGGDSAEQVVVHNRGLGYVVDPTSTFVADSGTTMVPFPLNEVAGPLTTFLWRDTSNVEVGGPMTSGAPTDFELNQFPSGYPAPLPYDYDSGSVPTIGLPLLMEFRTFPTTNGLGLNQLLGASAVPAGSALAAGEIRPFFRAYSEGGTDVLGNQITIDPDLTDSPTGGFNPLSLPNAGQPTPSADNVMYPGQLDVIISLSRLQTTYFDAEFGSPDYRAAIVEPEASEQPVGTALLVEYRGASQFTGTGGAEFNAGAMDPYGDPTPNPLFGGTVTYTLGSRAWTPDVDDLDGAPFIQMQVTFFNNIGSGESPELDTLVLPYGEQ